MDALKPFSKMMFTSTALIGLSISTQLMAMDGQALYLNPAKGGCSACHGKDGKTPLLPTYPKLAGQNSEYLYNQMKDIQSGARDNGLTAAMKSVIKMTTDEEKRAIAKWLSTLD
jgi:cytochrome c